MENRTVLAGFTAYSTNTPENIWSWPSSLDFKAGREFTFIFLYTASRAKDALFVSCNGEPGAFLRILMKKQQ